MEENSQQRKVTDGEEPEERFGDTIQDKTSIGLILFILFIFLAGEFYTQYNNALHQNDNVWYITHGQTPSLYQTTDKAKISITRVGSAIEVRYLGGQDHGFIGDFRITVDNETTYYKNPGQHNPVAMIDHWKFTCVDVEAMDKAVQTYRPVGSACL